MKNKELYFIFVGCIFCFIMYIIQQNQLSKQRNMYNWSVKVFYDNGDNEILTLYSYQVDNIRLLTYHRGPTCLVYDFGNGVENIACSVRRFKLYKIKI